MSLKRQPLSDYRAELYRDYTRPPSLETLRRRCKAGKIPAVHEDGRWYVLVKEPKPHKPRRNIVAAAEHVISLLVAKKISGRVYLAESSGRLKIGWTRGSPEKRMRGLQTSCPAPITLVAHIPGDHQHERMVHSIFQRHRLAGEWFRDHPDIRWFFERAKESVA